jgi:hypothetical protein
MTTTLLPLSSSSTTVFRMAEQSSANVAGGVSGVCVLGRETGEHLYPCDWRLLMRGPKCSGLCQEPWTKTRVGFDIVFLERTELKKRNGAEK